MSKESACKGFLSVCMSNGYLYATTNDTTSMAQQPQWSKVQMLLINICSVHLSSVDKFSAYRELNETGPEVTNISAVYS